MIKTLLTALTLTSLATPVLAQSNHDDHVRLARAVEKVGVTVHVNHKVCDTVDTYGMYIPDHKVIVICQEGKIKGSTKTVSWTEEDYDTLRHEVHHVVQDCRDGLNGQLNAVYSKPVQLGYDTLGKSKTHHIAQLYASKGASQHIQVMEVEAFSVAAMNDPLEQVSDINTYCF